MKGSEQAIAVQLLRDHPGWSDQRVARELHARKIRVASSTVQRWRTDAGLAPYTKNVAAWPPPRPAGVPLDCGHLVHPENLTADGHGRCGYCGST